jgi:hypothetical protein
MSERLKGNDMKRGFRDEWSAALRSGQYAQCRSVLYRLAVEEDSSHVVGLCCLGVRMELDVAAGRMLYRDVDSPYGGRRRHYAEGTLPERWVDLLPSIETCQRWGLSYTEAQDLARMNDDEQSFNTIADYLDTLAVED